MYQCGNWIVFDNFLLRFLFDYLLLLDLLVFLLFGKSLRGEHRFFRLRVLGWLLWLFLGTDFRYGLITLKRFVQFLLLYELLFRFFLLLQRRLIHNLFLHLYFFLILLLTTVLFILLSLFTLHILHQLIVFQHF